MEALAERTIAQGVEYDRGTAGDIYYGKPEALIAAGLLRPEQIPGWPGMPSTSATFLDGVPVEGRQRVRHDERWMQVTRIGSNIRLTKGVSIEEQRCRLEGRQAEIEEAARNRPKPDIGIDQVRAAFAEASARLSVGDKVWIGKYSAIVTGEYKLRRVSNKDGEFLDAEKGCRIDYQYGYTCQFRNGEEYFYEPGSLTDEDGAPTHLRLVAGNTCAARAMLAFRGRQ